MNIKLKVPDYIAKIAPYVPGKPIETLEREYGIHNSIKLASNENPLGASPFAVRAIRSALEKLNRYPDGAGYMLVEKIAQKLHVGAENIVIGNGSDDIIALLARALVVPGDEVIFPKPSFLMYDITAKSAGAVSVPVPLDGLHIQLKAIKEAVTEKTRIIFICNPNNPTGTYVTQTDFDDFMASLPEHVVVVVDEAYIEFARDPLCLKTLEKPDFNRPLVTLRTFSKAYGLAGLRVGYGVMPAALAEILNRVRQPFNVNSLAQAGATAALEDSTFLKKTIKATHQGLVYLYSELDRLGLDYFPSEANFFLIDVGKNADEVFESMLRLGVITRSMTSYGYPEYIRINVGLPQENERFVKALEQVL